MRIVQLLDSLHYGGAEQVVVTLSLGLRALGHELLVVCLRDFGDESVDFSRLQRAAIQVIALDKPEGPHYATLRHLWALIKRERIDIVNTHNHLVHHYGLTASLLTGVPVVNTVHGIDTLNLGSLPGFMYYGCSMLSDCIVSVCKPVQQELIRRFDVAAEKLAIIENGINIKPFLSVTRRPAENPPVFGTVGRFVPVKDHRIAIGCGSRDSMFVSRI